MEEISPFAKELAISLLDSSKFNCQLVGGVVRDRLLGVKVKDVDFLLDVENQSLKVVYDQLVSYLTLQSGEKYSVVSSERIKDFRTFKIGFKSLLDSFEFDFVFTRREYYSKIAVRPVVEAGGLMEDLARRDFSINAMAASKFDCRLDSITDVFDGIGDLRKKQIKILHDLSFRDDPSRLIRAVKFKNRFGFTLEGKTTKLFNEAIVSCYLPLLSSGRRYSEFLKLFSEATHVEILIELLDTGLLHQIFEVDEGLYPDQLRESLSMCKVLSEEEFLVMFFNSLDASSKRKVLANFPIIKSIKEKLRSL